jgi:hypothetical protein
MAEASMLIRGERMRSLISSPLRVSRKSFPDNHKIQMGPPANIGKGAAVIGIDPGLINGEGNAAVEGSCVNVAIPQSAGQGLANRRLAGAGRPVDGDDEGRVACFGRPHGCIFSLQGGAVVGGFQASFSLR